jgi:hypothetical protein
MFYLDKRDLENLINQSKNKYRSTVFTVTYVEFLKTKKHTFQTVITEKFGEVAWTTVWVLYSWNGYDHVYIIPQYSTTYSRPDGKGFRR